MISSKNYEQISKNVLTSAISVAPCIGLYHAHSATNISNFLEKSLENVPAVAAEAHGPPLTRISTTKTHYTAYQRAISEIDMERRAILFGRWVSR